VVARSSGLGDRRDGAVANALVVQAPVELRSQSAGLWTSAPGVGLVHVAVFQKPAIGFRAGPSL
jgi:hypothetical protein